MRVRLAGHGRPGRSEWRRSTAGPPRARLRRCRRGRAALAAAILAALALVSGAQHAAYGVTEGPYGGTPAAVPGTVQAANYDTGGQGVAYNVTSVNGTANSYRSDGVDLEDTADTQDTSAAGGAYDMGWTTAGQWFNYTVEVATAGVYTVSFRVSSPYGIADALHIASSSGTSLTGAVAVPNTGGYETWTTVTASITLPAGQQTLTVDQDSNGWNFHYMAFTQGSGGGGGGSGSGGYCGIQDLAMDQPATASSTQDATDYPASDATDGDPGTRWSSAFSDPQWLEVDLGSQQQICSVGILWEAAYATAFQIQVSNDNSTWTTIYSTTTGTGGNETFPVSVTARYIRMYGTVRATQFGYSIFEFDVYGLTTTPPLSGGNGNGGNGACPWVGSTAPVAQRVQQVLNTMDQSEELTLVAGDGSSSYIGQVAGIPDLCIPAMNLEDGPDGVGDGNGGVTAFPDGESAAATWDPALIEQEGAAMGAEFAGKGVNVSLGPTTNLVRDPRWGRTYETYGEDPYLAGQITSAEVEGLQSQGVMAMVKHAAAYDQEQYPNGNDNETVSQQALEELYLAPFQNAIQQSAPASVMCSYAVVNGASSCENADLLQDGLDEQANFGGFVVSDWGAAGPAVADAEGGTDIAMPFNSYATGLGTALSDGEFNQETLNAIVARILTEMFAFGMFDNPQTGSLPATVTTAAHQQTALELGEEGTVLLKNNGILPLNPNGNESIAVIGTDGGAGVEIAGGGSGSVNGSNTVWPLTGIQDAVGPDIQVTYTPGDDNGTTDIPQAVAAAQAATDAIIFVSDPEGEESDLTTLDLSSADETMIEDVAAVNPNTIVVINSGSPVVMPWLNDVAGVFENWYGGDETGAAVAALIFGTVDPSGKLPVTFPASLSQVPAQTEAQWPGTSSGVDYSEGVDIGYRWYQSQNITPLFPFGYGLSYTNFSFSNLKVGAFNANGAATVTATITNTGSVAGADVAQLYVGDPAASQDPPEQLKGFQRVTLNPGQSATVSFPLTIHDLASWSPADNAWEAQAGTYSVSVGDSSAHLPLTGSASLATELTGQVAAGTSGAGVSPANTAVSANVTPNSGVPGAETVGVVNPYGYGSPEGAAVSFSMQAEDSNPSQTLTFTATGLPPGITIAANGTISGSASTLGTYTVTVTATDTEGVSGTATFVWSVVQ